MDAERKALAQACVTGAHAGTLGFPQIVERMGTAGFEGYAVDYRREVQTFYTPEGDSVVLDLPPAPGPVAAVFDAAEMKRLVRWAQASPADYSYQRFSTMSKAAGCAGYVVSLPGRRVVYFGRTAETHVELFPS